MPRRPLPSISPALLPALGLGLVLGCTRGGDPEPPTSEPPAQTTPLPLFDPGSVGPGEAPPSVAAAPIAVVGYGPRGRTEGGGDIHIRFNQAVRPLGLDDDDADGLIALDPPIAGDTRWKAPDLLVFEPGEVLPPARAFKVRLARPITASDGRTFAGPLEWSFETPRPQVIEGGPVTEDVARRHRRTAYFVLFDHPVSAAEARAHLRARARPQSEAELDRDDDAELPSADAPASAVAIDVRPLTKALLKRHDLEDRLWRFEEGHGFIVTPRGLWPGGSRITVEVTPGLRGEAGPLPLETPWSASFTTYGPQKVLAATCGADEPCGLEPIELRLRNPIKRSELKKITISPRPKNLSIDLVDEWDEEAGGREITISGSVLPGTTYTIKASGEIKDIYGQRLGAPLTHRVTIERQPSLALSDRSATLIGREAPKIGLTARHVERVEVKVARLDDAAAAALLGRREGVRAIPWPADAKSVSRRELDLRPSGPTEWAELALDLRDYVGDARGAFVVEVRPLANTAAAREQAPADVVRGLFRITDMGPIALTSLPGSLVRVADLGDGHPIAGAKVSYRAPSGSITAVGETDASGVVELGGDLVCAATGKKASETTAETKRSRRPNVRQAKKAGAELCAGANDERGVVIIAAADQRDRAYLALDAPALAEGLTKGLRPGERLRGKVISERGAYRPGEKVHVVGWTAVLTPFARSGLRRPPRTPVQITLVDPRGEVVAEVKGRTSAEGKLAATLTLPEHAPLGRYEVKAELEGETLSASIKVEDYRTPEFEVGARAEHADVIADGGQEIHVGASYYFGGPVTIESVRYQPECRPAYFRPPGLEPRWRVGARDPERQSWLGTPTIKLAAPNAAEPDRDGKVDFRVATQSSYPGHADRCTVSVEVRDVSFQGIGAEASYLVHPAAYYLAIAVPERTPAAGDRYDVPLRAITHEGKRVAASAVQVSIERTSREPVYRSEGGRKVLYGYEEKTRPVKKCALDLSAGGDDRTCALSKLSEGTYTITARGREGGHETLSEASFWVRRRSGSAPVEWQRPPALSVQPSANEVHPGEPLQVVVGAPWELEPGLLVVERDGIRERHPLRFKDGRAEVDFKADDTWTPGVHFEAYAVRSPGKGALPKLERARSSVAQGYEHRRLGVVVDAPSEARPGQEATVKVTIRDAEGAPSAGRLALWAVDEAVLSLTEYEVPDLLPSFIPATSQGVDERDDFATLRLPFVAGASDPWLDGDVGGLGLMGTGAGGGGAGYGARGRAAGVPPPARSRFETTPVFLADLAIGEGGTRSVKVTFPDNLTTFRVFAVASDRLVDRESPGRFGLGDARVRVTRPLVLRPALPRGLRPGDRSEIAAIIQNRTSRPGKVKVELALSGPAASSLRVTSAASRELAIEADGQVRVPFALEALRVGAPEVELRATFVDDRGEQRDDAVRLPLPVEAERTQVERVATYGTLADDGAVAIPVRIPADALPDFGGVTVSTTSTLLGGVEDAVHELIHYPYGCVEQTASRLLPLVAIADIKRTFPLDVDVDDLMSAGVERILSMQTSSGGFAYWPGGDRPSPYASAYATWVLQRAAKAGHKVPAGALESALGYVARLVDAEDDASADYFDQVGEVRRAIALHTLAEAGRASPAATERLYAARARLPLFARAFLLMAIHAANADDPRVRELADELLANLSETPGTAHAKEAIAFDLSGVFHSDGRSDAIVLMALLRAAPDHPVIPKLVRGLLERRNGGAWRNTQENAYALVALGEYVERYEKETPHLVARAWVGRMQILDAVFRGRETVTRSGELGMAPILAGLADAGPGSGDLLRVILQRQGSGRLYYRLGAEWAPRGSDLPERAQGLRIRRSLRTREGALAAGAAVGPGETVAVDIDLHVDDRVAYVAVDVPIPAGLEAIQRDLGRGQRAMTLSGHRGWWVSFEEQRRDRVVLFADDLQPGDHRHTVYLRATTPGAYVMPPALAEAMYMPEIYGRSTALAVEVASP
ncbi:MAG: hypothetical protein H6711_32015 [Myxococcales bacterium]|nr:hypothetical protein [Myxococcales bacterium]